MLIDFKNPITINDLKQFLETDHNILVFGDIDAKKPIRSLVNEFGMEFENAVSYHCLKVHSITFNKGL